MLPRLLLAVACLVLAAPPSARPPCGGVRDQVLGESGTDHCTGELVLTGE